MNIIICGAGRVGFTIAKLLTEQNHSITVIDQSSEDIQKINESLDVKAIVGKATSPEILDRANTVEADMLIAVTRNDEINMLICQIAYSLFKVPKKIARIRSQEYLDPKFSTLFNKENLPIDYVISPEIEIAKSLQRKLEAPGALDSVPFTDNKIRLLEILIKKNCASINIKFNELTKKYPKLDANIIAINRDEKFFIPKKTDAVKEGDKIKVKTISKVLESKNDNFKIGEYILGPGCVQDYYISDGENCEKFNIDKFNYSENEIFNGLENFKKAFIFNSKFIWCYCFSNHCILYKNYPPFCSDKIRFNFINTYWTFY